MYKKFDIKSYLSDLKIEFKERGVNVKKGEIEIRCPFCIDDPSFHLGINIENQLFACWRNSQHRGSFIKLIAKLSNCSYKKAAEILGIKEIWFNKSESDTFFDNPTAFFESQINNSNLKLELPKQFIEIKDFSYLISRGFLKSDIPELCQLYQLKFCNDEILVNGKKHSFYKNRIIFPIYINSTLQTWTSRSIGSDNIRYLNLSRSDGALISIKELLYNYENLLIKSNILFITEGPFDALKLDFYGREYGCRATCLFGKDIKTEQLNLISKISENFNEIIVCLDSDEVMTGIQLEGMLLSIGLNCRYINLKDVLQEDIKDPGDMSKRQVKNLCQNMLKSCVQ